jgi:hypothetical protein
LSFRAEGEESQRIDRPRSLVAPLLGMTRGNAIKKIGALATLLSSTISPGSKTFYFGYAPDFAAQAL